jgi:hypothetical protein
MAPHLTPKGITKEGLFLLIKNQGRLAERYRANILGRNLSQVTRAKMNRLPKWHISIDNS